MIHGRDLILSYNGNPIAAAKSCDVGIDTDFIEVANPTEGSWKEYRPTIHGWSAGASCLVAKMEDVDKLFDIQKSKQLLALAFFDTDLMSYYQGSAYIKGLKVSGSVGSLATMSVDFQTSGELKRAQAQVLNIRTAAETYEQRILDWNDDEVEVRENLQGETHIIAYEFTATANTRVTALYKSLVVKGGLETIGPMIVQNRTEDLLANAVLINYKNTDKSAVATALRNQLTLTMIMNLDEARLPYQFITLTKQITQ